MADDLELEMQSTEGEGPSPEFVTRLRERIVAEMATSVLGADDEFVVAIDPRPKQKEQAMTKTRWMFVGAAAAAVALIVGLVSIGGDSDRDSLETASEAEVPTSTAEEPTVAPEEPTAAQAEPPSRVSEAFDPDAMLFPKQFGSVPSGSHRADNFLRPFSVTLEQSLFLQENLSNRLVLTNPVSREEGDKDIVFMRLSGLWDPARMDEQPDSQGDGSLREEFGVWLDDLPEGLVASNREETSLDGFDATRFDLEVDASVCDADLETCLALGTNETGFFTDLGPGRKYRIWVVEQDGDVPFAVAVGINNEADSGWLDFGERLVLTLGFGDVEPNS